MSAEDDEPQVEEQLAQWAEVQKRVCTKISGGFEVEELSQHSFKTFTRWMNVHLAKRGLKVHNLSSDLQDGTLLINVLEEISGQKIPKYP